MEAFEESQERGRLWFGVDGFGGEDGVRARQFGAFGVLADDRREELGERPAVLPCKAEEAVGVLLLAELENREQELDLGGEVVQQGLAGDAELAGDHVE